MPSLYMVVDITAIAETKIRYVADAERAILLASIYMNNRPGRKCIAPVLEGRGFSKMDLQTLQYLYWNTFNKTPSDDYAQLIKNCLAEAEFLEVNIDKISTLNTEKAISENDLRNAAPAVKALRVPSPVTNTTPKKTSTCGFIWEICDKHNEAFAGLLQQDRKLFRKGVMHDCEKEGINSSTAAVQFGKWEKTKTGS